MALHVNLIMNTFDFNLLNLQIIHVQYLGVAKSQGI